MHSNNNISFFFCNRVIIFLRYYLGCIRHRVVYGENIRYLHDSIII